MPVADKGLAQPRSQKSAASTSTSPSRWTEIRVELFLHELRQAALGFGALAESRAVQEWARILGSRATTTGWPRPQ